MNNLILPVIFYTLITFYVICFYKNYGFKIISNHVYFNEIKYYIGTAAYFFMNINILFYCALGHHCHTLCIPITMSAVLIGAIVYLAHLVIQTIHLVTAIVAGKKFDLMAPFFSIPYFLLIYEILSAASHGGFQSLHSLESKMVIVTLYPLSIVLVELMLRIKKRRK